MSFECQLILYLEKDEQDKIDKHFPPADIDAGSVFLSVRPHLSEHLSVCFYEPQTQKTYAVTCVVTCIEQAVVTQAKKTGTIRVTAQVPKSEENWPKLLDYLIAMEGKHDIR